MERVGEKDNEAPKMDVDSALKLVGGYRRWNLAAFCLLSFSVFLPQCWQGLSIVFIGWTQPHHCRVPDGQLLNESIPTYAVDGEQQYRKCSMYVDDVSSNKTTDCQDGWTYDSKYTSVVSEWDLVCEKDYQSELAQTIYQIGCLCGELFGALLVDKFGRRRLHIASGLSIVALGIGVAFAPSYIAFVVMRTVLGFIVTCNYLSGLTMILEIFDASKRAVAGICLEFAWIVVFVAMPWIAYAITDWRYFQLTVSLGTLISALYLCLLPESAVWLFAQGRYDESEEVLERIAKLNGLGEVKVNLTRLPPALLVDYKKYMEEKKKRQSSRRRSSIFTRRESMPMDRAMQHRKSSRMAIAYEVTILDLVRDPVLRRHTVIASLFWFANNLVYYGLILCTPTLAGDRFVNFLIGGLVEIPAYVITLLVVERFGRKVPLCVFHIIAGIPLGVVAFMPTTTSSGTDLSGLVTAFAMIAKFAISGSFAIIILYTRELFPTNLRATSGGLCNVWGRVANMVAPFAAYVARNDVAWLPNLTFGAVSIVVGFVVLLLPETTDKPLPDTLDDVLNLYPQKRRLSIRRESYKPPEAGLELKA